MATERKGGRGGTIRPMEKGDPPLPGGGRPPGSRTFKALFDEALAKVTKDKDGKPVELKEQSALQIIAIVISAATDDNTKLKAFQLIRDTIGEQPVAKSEVNDVSVKQTYRLPDGTDIEL